MGDEMVVSERRQRGPHAEELREAPKASPRRIWEYARPHWKVLLAGGLLTFLGGLTGLVQPLVAKVVIDALGAGESLARPLLLLTAAVIGGAVISAMGTFVLERTGQSVVLAVRQQLVSRLIRLRVAEVDRLKPGDLVSRLTADTTLLRTVATSGISNAFTSSVLLVAGIVLMAWMDPVLFGVTAVVIVLAAVTMVVVLPRIGRATEASQAALGEMGSKLERIFGAFRTIKASSAETAEIRHLDAAAQRAWRKGVAEAGWSAVAGVTAWLSTNIAFLAVLGVGGARVASGSLEVSSLIAFLLLLFYLMEPISTLVNAATELQSGLAAVRRIDEVGNLEREDTDAHRPEPAEDADASDAIADPGRSDTDTAHNGFPRSPVPGTRRPARVALTDVLFRYADGLPLVHHGVTFEAAGAGLTALVGPSGAGKTTVFSLLERFYDATGGTVAVDGVDVRDWPLAGLRGAIGYVEQDAPVLDGTLQENLVLAAPDATADEIAEVVRRARLSELVGRLPDGIDSAVGHRGTTLSGGERQRVAIARALLRRPRLLLLDEATSQLDAANEAALKEVMLDAARDTNVMVVAHRLSTVTSADRIVVLDAGIVRAVGTHAELVDSDDLYRDLAASQLLTAS
ncbi:ABC transporter ATP-binding protein [Nocardiopsis gilva YIM 90087]|uniref:ABC transporter ATP-binding protein n=1 Tax=Nocardiopsis gilva YIM 90087 TaxID=1235441 RepID=A0A223S8I5_9ACTN|nr:ABC transporter ATP-binding protein [Nocardiopsis gilva]ASU84435.1 ABC transporter ATP-binding protein [Nocardiopsis gilva YIM 90087]